MVQMRQPYERPALKRDAKAAMAKKSPTIYLLSLLMLVINLLPTAVIQGPVYLNAFRTGSLDGLQESLVVRMQTSGAGVSLVTMLINLFLSIVAVGYCRYCLRVSREEETGGAEELFRCFPQFWRFFVLNLLTGLFVMLWSFLLIIPGIIAALSYSQATFLMLDDPELSALDAIRQSKALMRGHKGEYFTLCLSFFGWLLLSAPPSVPKVKQVSGLDLQHLTQPKDHVKGHAHIAQLNGADMAPVDLRKLRQLQLGELFPLAVIDHIQAKLFIKRFILFFHSDHPCSYCRVPTKRHKPCKNRAARLTQVI